MLTKEEEAEIDQQAEDIKREDKANIACLFMVIYYAVAIALIFWLGTRGWYFLLGSITTALLIGKIYQINNKNYE
jgi:hypothetical protein